MREKNCNTTKKGQIIILLHRFFGVDKMYYIKFICGIVAHPISKIVRVHRLNKMVRKNNEKMNKVIWRKNFLKLIMHSNDLMHDDMIKEFWTSELTLIKNCELTTNSPVCICAVKDDLIRMREFIKYYRNGGVELFIIIDNGSTDGTREFLESQNDVKLYYTTSRYNSARKTAWINKVIAFEEKITWTLIVDVDEFFAFPSMREITLKEYSDRLLSKGFKQVKTFMLDMYPEGELCDESMNPNLFVQEYCYFDCDNDYYWISKEFGYAGGGMHARVFGLENDVRTKISLLYIERERFMVGSHNMFPIKDDIKTPIGAIVKHYKFLPGDKKKIDKIVQDGNYCNGSRMYKRYQSVLNSDSISAFYKGSVKWDDGEAFNYLGFVKDCLDEI